MIPNILRFLSALQICALLPVSTSLDETPEYLACKDPLPFYCGSFSLNISFPFLAGNRSKICGLPDYRINCLDGERPTMQFHDRSYLVKAIDYEGEELTLEEMKNSTVGDSCPDKFVGNDSIYDWFHIGNDVVAVLLYSCEFPTPEVLDMEGVHRLNCKTDVPNLQWYFVILPEEGNLYENPYWIPGCIPNYPPIWLNRTAVELLKSGGETGFGDALSLGFNADWKAGDGWCRSCLQTGGVCGYNSSQPSIQTCFCPDRTGEGSCAPGRGLNMKKKVIIGVCSLLVGFVLALIVVYIWLRRRQGKVPGSFSRNLLVRSTSVDLPSMEKDPEAQDGSYIYTPIFTYEELEFATGGFNSSRELGDGGFGVVYKGTLKDGRVVAVKRLHERNYRRVQQFRNEVEILNRIRHPNLVSLYGCTTRDSRELLLVYEYVSNGTVADHLHGSRAGEHLLTWPLRLSIAFECAAALAYLHASEPQIIHRDVKTSNILLDNEFHVKVADFGLSRQFPTMMATHISTAPQGTPGYVDPEYHQFYQLTDKSDVYSFGVVLVELISSMPAVDMERPRSEINLSNLAMSKISRGQIQEIIDPTLGFDTDLEVRQSIETVAELAFRCLQPEKDMRPSMDEVRDALDLMLGGNRMMSPIEEKHVSDDTSLLKSSGIILSPDTVVGKWASKFTTPNTSS